jgi:hypothetical protein
MQGLYNTNETTKTAANKTTWLQPGIHNDLKLVDVKYDVSKNGKEFLAFYVENAQGDTVSCTEWPFNPKKPFEEMDATEKETAISIIENQKSKVKQIVEVFKPNFNITADSFKDFAEKTVAFLADSYRNVPIRIKVVYDKRGWTTFGQSSKTVFIEKMTVSDADSKIRILQSDRMTRPAQPEDESKETNPVDVVDTPITPATTEDDLPF